VRAIWPTSCVLAAVRKESCHVSAMSRHGRSIPRHGHCILHMVLLATKCSGHVPHMSTGWIESATRPQHFCHMAAQLGHGSSVMAGAFRPFPPLLSAMSRVLSRKRRTACRASPARPPPIPQAQLVNHVPARQYRQQLSGTGTIQTHRANCSVPLLPPFQRVHQIPPTPRPRCLNAPCRSNTSCSPKKLVQLSTHPHTPLHPLTQPR
jgi:hypothetical protein